MVTRRAGLDESSGGGRGGLVDRHTVGVLKNQTHPPQGLPVDGWPVGCGRSWPGLAGYGRVTEAPTTTTPDPVPRSPLHLPIGTGAQDEGVGRANGRRLILQNPNSVSPTESSWSASTSPKTPPCRRTLGARSGCVLLRKEVIQPHLPVRLPCYDFVPIASPTFDHSLRKTGWAVGFGCCRLS